MRATDYLFLVVIIGLVVGIVSLGATDFNTMDAGNQIDITNLQYKWPINRCGFQEHWIPIKEIINMKKK